MSLYNSNLQYLEKYYPILHSKIVAGSPQDSSVSVTQVEDNYVLRRENISCYAYSMYDIDGEIDDMFRDANPEAEVIIIFGFGLGHAVKYALQNFPKLSSLIVVEPSMTWFKTTMQMLNLAELIKGMNEKIILAVDTDIDIVSRLIASEVMFADLEPAVVFHLTARTLFSDYYTDFIAQTIDQVRSAMMNTRTTRVMLTSKTRNSILNLSIPTHSFEDFENIFKNKDVIIVSAGPSLQKNIDLLEQAKEKAIIIAVGTAIRILDARGIRPHFRMVVDPYAEEREIFDNLTDRTVPLLFTNFFFHDILPEYQGPLIRVDAAGDYIGQYIYNSLDRKTITVNTGPSVANVAVFTMCAVRCRSVIFVGQDMCMYGKQLHADIEEDSTCTKARIITAEDIYGKTVYSPINYYLIKQSLDVAAKLNGNTVTFINATEGGLGILGVPNKTLAEVLADLAADNFNDEIAAALEASPLIEYEEAVINLLEQINKLTKFSKRKLKLLKSVEDSIHDGIFSNRQKMIAVFKDAQKLERKIQAEPLYKKMIELELYTLLTVINNHWSKDLESTNEARKFRSIGQMQLRTAIEVDKVLTVFKHYISQVKDQTENAKGN